MTRPASRGPNDLVRALEALPLFPLQQAVLFPGALLPLHVFEPRYRAMIRDVLDTHRTLAVVLITDPNRLDEHGHPAIAKVAGAGTLIDHTELPGGRYHILLRGRARVRLLVEELLFVRPYRRAAATVLEPPRTAVSQGDLSALLSTATAFTAIVRQRHKSFEFSIPPGSPAGVIADLCAHHLVLDARERQSILEMLDPVARVRRVAEVLAMQQLTLSAGEGEAN